MGRFGKKISKITKNFSKGYGQIRFYVINYGKTYYKEESVGRMKASPNGGAREIFRSRFMKRRKIRPWFFVKIDKYYTQTAGVGACRER